MSHRHKVTALTKLMVYVLRYRPDEFGLVLDEDGFIPLKELQQAIAEEEGWSYVRPSHITEAAYTSEREHFDIEDNRIRHSLCREIHYEQTSPPRILYHGTRHRAYPHILHRGLNPLGKRYVHLTTTPELAIRIGRRRDLHPLLLEVLAQRASENGVVFFQVNPLIYLAEHIPPTYINGPPVSKVLPEKKLSEKGRLEKEEVPGERELPGSVLLNLRMQPLHREAKGKTWKDLSRRNRRGQRQV